MLSPNLLSCPLWGANGPQAKVFHISDVSWVELYSPPPLGLIIPTPLRSDLIADANRTPKNCCSARRYDTTQGCGIAPRCVENLGRESAAQPTDQLQIPGSCIPIHGQRSRAALISPCNRCCQSFLISGLFSGFDLQPTSCLASFFSTVGPSGCALFLPPLFGISPKTGLGFPMTGDEE